MSRVNVEMNTSNPTMNKANRRMIENCVSA